MPDYHVKRCFLALRPDEVVLADLGDVMDAIDIDGLRLLKPDTLHVTLKFLGNIDAPDLPAVIEAAGEAAALAQPFDLNVTGMSYLPGARRPRVLAVEFDAPEALGLLFESVEDAMQRVGFRREGRPLRPHVTLGRFKNPPPWLVPPLEDYLVLRTGWRVDRVTFYESKLHPGGAQYAALAELPLGQGR